MFNLEEEKVPEVLSFSNDYTQAKKALSARAFYLFHSCQLRCYQANKQAEMCREQCEISLDKYFEYKRRTKLAQKVLFAGNRSDLHEWERLCARVEGDQQARLAKLGAWLDQQEAGLKTK